MRPAKTSRGEEVFPGYAPGTELGWGARRGRAGTIGPDHRSLQVRRVQGCGLGLANLRYRSRCRGGRQSRWRHHQRRQPEHPAVHGTRRQAAPVSRWADPLVAPGTSINYYNSVVKALGGAVENRGVGPAVHGARHGSLLRAERDRIRSMSSARWSGGSSKGKPPDRIVASHSTNGVVDRTRPLCPYPQVAAYKGTGSTDEAVELCVPDPGVMCECPRRGSASGLPAEAAAPAARRRVIISPRSRADTGRAAVTRQAFVAWLMCASGVALAGTHVLVATQENSQIPPAARNYWAFKLPVRSPVPDTATRFDNPIDRFLEKARGDRGLEPAPRASRLTLLRRAYLDLIGLPPSPAETAAFLADDAPDAWPRLIDTLLASPHYGERWGRHWLDVARYADSSGFEQDYDRPNAWRYRDYVIRAFNQDKPYDQFLEEQLAGDELETRSDETFIATGFLRAGPRVAFREKDNPERRYEYLDDLIATTGRGLLGLTVQCARCHNHKFDPIPQRDYYSLVTTFFGYVETTHPLVPPAEAAAYEKKMREIDARQAAVEGAGQTDRGAVRTAPAPGGLQEVSRRGPAGHRQAGARADAGRTASRTAGHRADQSREPRDRRDHDSCGRGQGQGARGSDRRARQAAAGADSGGRNRDRRGLPLRAERRGRRGDRLSEMPNHRGPAGRIPAFRTRTLSGAAVVFPASRRSQHQGIGDEAGVRRRGDLRNSADRDSARRWPHIRTPAGTRRMAGVAAEPADGPRHRQPHLAPPFRPRHRRDAGQLRQDGRRADASRVARLAGGGVHESRLEHQADAPVDHDLRRLPDGVRVRTRGESRQGSAESIPVALPRAAPRRGSRARQHPDRERRHQPRSRRSARSSRRCRKS